MESSFKGEQDRLPNSDVKRTSCGLLEEGEVTVIGVSGSLCTNTGSRTALHLKEKVYREVARIKLVIS